MNEPIFSPLDFYVNEGKARHEKNVDEYFAALKARANVNDAENKATVAKYNAKRAEIDGLENSVSGYKRLRAWSIFGIVIAWLIAITVAYHYIPQAALQAFVIAACLATAITGIVLICKHTSKKIKGFSQRIATEQTAADGYFLQAQKQAAPLNALFDDEDALKLFSKTLPFVSFDDYLNESRLADLQAYGYTPYIDVDETVTQTLSGELYGDPFVFERRLRYYMGEERYTGSKTISWTTTYRDSQGRTQTQTHTQTLYASVVKPKPFYRESAGLHYGNDAAPDLHFSRSGNHVECKSRSQIERMVRAGEKKIERLVEKAAKEGDDFTGVLNTEFDVLFNALDRDDELQFRQTFTPLAQESTLKLLLSKEGYGDDFSFVKNGKLNTISSDHALNGTFSTGVHHYISHDIAQAEENFKSFNNAFFKSLYFDFAPILAIPLYKEYAAVKNTRKSGRVSQHVLENLAYGFRMYLAPDNAQTLSILKTQTLREENGALLVEVTARAFDTEKRVDYIRVHGGDGNWHDVPVYWTLYIPVQRKTVIRIVKKGNEVPADKPYLTEKSFTVYLENG